MTESGVSAQMPRYVCHKHVHALKLKAVVITPDGNADVQPEGDVYADFLVTDKEVVGRLRQASAEDPGYYVVYEDGYVSWSPTKAFEEGYTLD